jgi:hypothetical protein
VERLEAPLGGPLGDHPPTSHRLGEPFEPLHPEVSTLEQAAQQVAGAVRHDDGSRLCQVQDASRQVRRLANHRFLLRRALPDQVANHYEAGRNAHAGRQRRAIGPQSSHSADQLQAGVDRTLGIALMGPRPAEINERMIACVSGEVPVPTLDHPSAALLIGVDHPAHILGIEPRQKRRRPYQITEQHRQLAPLGFGSDEHSRLLRFRIAVGWLYRPRALLRAQRSDRFEELLAVAERDAEFFQIGFGQVRQDISVNIIVAERLFVPRQSQIPEPRRDIHGDSPVPTIGGSLADRRGRTNPLGGHRRTGLPHSDAPSSNQKVSGW